MSIGYEVSPPTPEEYTAGLATKPEIDRPPDITDNDNMSESPDIGGVVSPDIFNDEGGEQEKDDKDTGEGATELRKTYYKQVGAVALLTAEQEVDLAKRIEAGLLAGDKLDTEPNINDQLRSELGLVARDGKLAKAHMLEANLRLVISLAARYQGKGLSLLDLIQEGNLGLQRALEKFDYTKGYKFSTYAPWWIHRAIRRGLADSARTVRVPVGMVDNINSYAGFRQEMMRELRREPTVHEIATRYGMDPEVIAKWKAVWEINYWMLSTDQPVGGDDPRSLGDTLQDEYAQNPSEVVERQDMVDAVAGLLDTLPPNERHIITRLFMCEGKPPMLGVIGQEIGLTDNQVARLRDKALRRLKREGASLEVYLRTT